MRQRFDAEFMALWSESYGQSEREDPELVDAARRLIGWEEWEHRHDESGEYAWGFKSDACRFLFDRDPQGRWYTKTNAALEIAERLSQSSNGRRNSTTNGRKVSRGPSPRRRGARRSVSRSFEASRPERELWLEMDAERGVFGPAPWDPPPRSQITLRDAYVLWAFIACGSLGGMLVGISFAL